MYKQIYKILSLQKKLNDIMKSVIILITVSFLGFLNACNSNSQSADAGLIENNSSANDPNSKGNEPIMTFDKETFDFGTINEGEVVEHTYNFKNTGNKPLLISEVQVSCGCTVPVWPREPINPGQSSSIKLQFNSNNKPDQILKDVTIISNANPVKKKLTFTAFVIKKPRE